MTGTILDKIIAAKQKRVADAKALTTVDSLLEIAERVNSTKPSNRFLSAIKREDRTNIIAEFKRASPSKGVINGDADAAETAIEYHKRGAAAISVLTEEDFFQGSVSDLKAVRDAVKLPILRKDFVIDEYQIYDSAALGADAVLLIVAALRPDELIKFQAVAHSIGLDALVEVHNAEEMMIASDIGAEIIGVNNRNLKTFEVSLDISHDLINRKHENAIMITESGISTAEEINELKALGFSAFLIGETLMRDGLGLLTKD